VQRWRWATMPMGGRDVILGTMKGFGKIALVLSLVGVLMAYFIIPCNPRARAPYHQPTRPSTP
jgi:hypothetical protein